MASHRARVLSLRWIGDQLLELICETEQDEILRPALFLARPGQFITLLCGENRTKRAYTLASASTAGLQMRFSFVAKLIPGGVGSEFIRNLAPDSRFEFLGPTGYFVAQSHHPGPIVLAATSVAIAPAYAFVLDLLAKSAFPSGAENSEKTAILAYFSAKKRSELAYFDSFNALASRTSRLAIDWSVTQPDVSWSGNRSRFTEKVLAGASDKATYYLVGSGTMIRDVTQGLLAANVGIDRKKQIHSEVFYPAPKEPKESKEDNTKVAPAGSAATAAKAKFIHVSLLALLLGATQHFAAGCSDRTGAEISSVIPSTARADRPTRLTIIGRHLDPFIRVNTSSGGAAAFDLFSGSVATIALTDVVRVGSNRVDATLPAGLASGRYDLSLRTPSGDALLLKQAIFVEPADTTAPKVQFELPAFSPQSNGDVTTVLVQAGELLQLKIRARDSRPGRVTELACDASDGDPRSYQRVAEPPAAEMVAEFQYRAPIPAAIGSRVTVTCRARDDAPDGHTGAASIALEIAPPPAGPQVTRVTPERGPIAGGQLVLISGAQFTNQTTVTICGQGLLNASVTSQNEIQGTIPAAMSVATCDVVALDPNGIDTLTDGYRYQELPILLTIEPSNGAATGGDRVVVTGIGLDRIVELRFGKTSAAEAATNLTLLSSDRLEVTSPRGRDLVDVLALTISSGPHIPNAPIADRLASSFRYWTTPTLLSISPESGTAGRTVTLRGRGFSPGVVVRFDGIDAPGVVVLDDTTILVEVPVRPTGIMPTGFVDVAVVTPIAQSVLPGAFEYR